MELRLHLASLRRLLVLAVLAALTAVPAASAAFQPIQPRLRRAHVPARARRHRDDPERARDGPHPRDRLAEAAAARAGVRPRPLRRRLGAPAERPLDARRRRTCSGSRREQTAAIAQLHRAMPAARVSLALPGRPQRLRRLDPGAGAAEALAPELRGARVAELHVPPRAEPQPGRDRRRRLPRRRRA